MTRSERRAERFAARRARRAWRTGSAHSQLVMGLLVIGIGMLFLLDNLGFIEIRHAITFWPLAFIVAGIVKMFDTSSPNNYVVGTILIVVGAVLVLNRIGIVYLSWQTMWPVLMIALGGLLLYRAVDSQRRRGEASEPAFGAVPLQKEPLKADAPGDSMVDATAILGGFERSVLSQDFRGGDVTAILGGCALDMRSASIKGEAVLDVFAFMGGITIKVPSDWTVVLHGTPILGGFEEKTAKPPDGSKRLVVTGYAILGGVEVRN
jgi:predicted membrane protein